MNPILNQILNSNIEPNIQPDIQSDIQLNIQPNIEDWGLALTELCNKAELGQCLWLGGGGQWAKIKVHSTLNQRSMKIGKSMKIDKSRAQY